ncbi:MAG: hypothetical protein LBT88_02415 [Oscillospiraceae bacterium]|nr:hypothetical protein [Oscillospiraceae bacterium]
MENKKDYILLEKNKALQYYQNYYQICDDPFDYIKENETYLKGRNHRELILEPYDKIIESYFFYRKDYFHRIDHGIIAGYLFFDRLKKNYKEAWDKLNGSGVEHDYIFDRFDYKGLVWSKELLLWFAYISQNIMAHNIWKSESDEDDKKYEAYSLEDLTREKFQSICIDKSPLLFFLCLLDTIRTDKTIYRRYSKRCMGKYRHNILQRHKRNNN